MNTSLGKRIAALRKERGLKQDDLARVLEVSPQAVSKWETDQTCPDISLLPELAKLLGVSVDVLLTGEPEPEVRLVPEKERKDLGNMILHITVDSAEGDRVRVNLPMGLVQLGLEMGMTMPGIDGNEALKKVDLKQVLEMARQGFTGDLVVVDTSDGDHVQINVE